MFFPSGMLMVPGGDPPRTSWDAEYIVSMPTIKMSDESDMDWDAEEEITQPGVGGIASPSCPTGPVGQPGYPTISTDGLSKGDRCYLCFGTNYIAKFTRSLGDTFIVCVHCLYDHLGWEFLPSGELCKVNPDI